MRPADAFEICHEVYVNARQLLDHQVGTLHLEVSNKYLWRPDNRPKLAEFVADFVLCGQRALAAPRLKERLRMFRLHYCTGVPYHAARARLGISELTWSNLAEEIRHCVGRELLRVGVFPPGRYFH